MPHTLDILSMSSIIDALPSVDFSKAERRHRAVLLQRVHQLPLHQQQALQLLAQQRQAERDARHAESNAKRDIARLEARRKRRVRTRRGPSPSRVQDEFLQIPSAEEQAQCYREFLAATSTSALVTKVCVICARECPAADCSSRIIDEIPNIQLLENPELPAHCPRYRDYVLETELLATTPEGRQAGNVCAECRSALGAAKRPKYALANGMWIGQTPLELQNLTHPEELLLGLHFPRVYFYKLRAKDRGAPQDPAHRQRAMVGNVVSFASNVDKIADMLAGSLMPRPPAVLASVLAVSFIGAGRLPKRWLNSTFRVRRERVRQALQWLIAHNPLYAGFSISNAHLEALPEDGIPMEIALNMRQNDDAAAAAREAESYVPDDTFEGAATVRQHTKILIKSQMTALQEAWHSFLNRRMGRRATTIKEVREQEARCQQGSANTDCRRNPGAGRWH